jgi:hypothetical protein
VEIFVHGDSLSFQSAEGKSRVPIQPARAADEPGRGNPKMQITVTVSDAIVREAAAHNLPVIDFVESLIDKGKSAAAEPAALENAIERIRALRSRGPGLRK